jgi:basic amino acid/polyamine antiporter, APA family
MGTSEAPTTTGDPSEGGGEGETDENTLGLVAKHRIAARYIVVGERIQTLARGPRRIFVLRRARASSGENSRVRVRANGAGGRTRYADLAMPATAESAIHTELRRVVGIPGAVLMGLGSILGTGIFVSIGIAADIAGPAVIVAVVLAAVVATFNGLSSAQLAANHPVSGGTYEYGYRYLNPWLGFSAGWMFLCAKTASAATAALGLAGYVLHMFGRSDPIARVALGLAVILVLTLVVVGGMQRSNRTNAVIVTVTLVALVALVGVGAADLFVRDAPVVVFDGVWSGDLRSILHATALMFVAYTGYGRIATLGEEIRAPRRSIPRAIIITLVISALLYAAVAIVAIATVGPARLAEATLATAAPLEAVARQLGPSWLPAVIAVGAITAMIGVILNLLLGISRVVLAMARRRDLPTQLATVRDADGSPTRAVAFTGVLIAALVSVGSIELTWTFSAFTVLVYYGLTNLAALRLAPEQRYYPRLVPALGLVSCLGVAAFVEPTIWLAGLGLLAMGLIGRWFVDRSRRA